MSVKERFPSLYKLFSFYEEIPEEFLDETDVDSYFYHNIFSISQSQHRLLRVSRRFNKKSFAIKLFQFSIYWHSNVISSEKKWLYPKENSVVSSTVCASFSKLLIKVASAYRFPYRSPKLRLDLQNQKSISLLITITISLNMQIDKIVYPFDLEKNNSCIFSIKKFELHGNHFILTEIVRLDHREIHYLCKNRYYVANKCQIIESIYDV